MFRSGWTVVGLGALFVVIQSCGDDMGTGRISTPGATGQQEPPQAQPVTQPGGSDAGADAGAGAADAGQPLGPGGEEDGGWPDYTYDDGRDYWDGGAPVVLDAWHWNQGVAQYRGRYGQRFTMRCIPMGSELAVWGTNPYTDDSPVCTAGAHLGLVTRYTGGEVTVEIRPAQRRFEGGDANGVTAFPWGPYPGSYLVLH